MRTTLAPAGLEQWRRSFFFFFSFFDEVQQVFSWDSVGKRGSRANLLSRVLALTGWCATGR